MLNRPSTEARSTSLKFLPCAADKPATGGSFMKSLRILVALSLAVVSAPVISGMKARAVDTIDYRVVATLKTSTMEKELNEGAAAGYRFQAVMGGETAFGGKEVVAIMSRPTGGGGSHYEYKLLATNKTGTMQKEVTAASEQGFEYRGQTVFDSSFGGKEVVCIFEKDTDAKAGRSVYRLLATSKTSTMEKELKQVGDEGFEIVGMTIGQTALGGKELVAIARRRK